MRQPPMPQRWGRGGPVQPGVAGRRPAPALRRSPGRRRDRHGRRLCGGAALPAVLPEYGLRRHAEVGIGLANADRIVTVRFDANVAPGLAWRFMPERRRSRPGSARRRRSSTGSAMPRGRRRRALPFNGLSGQFFVRINASASRSGREQDRRSGAGMLYRPGAGGARSQAADVTITTPSRQGPARAGPARARQQRACQGGGQPFHRQHARRPTAGQPPAPTDQRD